jgi:hypothetical protein
VLNLGTLSCNQAEQKVGNIIIKRIKKDTWLNTLAYTHTFYFK